MEVLRSLYPESLKPHSRPTPQKSLLQQKPLLPKKQKPLLPQNQKPKQHQQQHQHHQQQHQRQQQHQTLPPPPLDQLLLLLIVVSFALQLLQLQKAIPVRVIDLDPEVLSMLKKISLSLTLKQSFFQQTKLAKMAEQSLLKKIFFLKTLVH